MVKRIKNIPSPSILMNSMRSIGYSFKSAVADILDNSISANAKNIWIYFPLYNQRNLYFAILDDGNGMDETELLNAMKYGSERELYGDKDLGRFGIGLKSASLSQCKVLTVVSKKANKYYALRWDLDLIVDEWECLELDSDEIQQCPCIEKLVNLKQGTLVIWQNFDIAYKKSNGHTYEYLSEKLDETDSHLRLIFHRFMNRKINPIHFYINDDILTGFDPFLEHHPKVDPKKAIDIPVEYEDNKKTKKANIKVQQYILPHQNDLDKEDIDLIGGIESLKDNQGFFVYRNDRLIIYGTWFNLSSKHVNAELYKYGRIKVDIPNTLDDIWDIDIKKQNAVIPKNIINLLRKSVINVCEISKEKTDKRARLVKNQETDNIWLKTESRTGKDLFHINTDSPFVKHYLDSFSDADKGKVLRFIDALSASLPFDDIYVSVCNKNNETTVQDNIKDSLILLGIEQFKQIKETRQCSDELALEKLCKYPPFDNEEISIEIKRRLCGDK